MLSDCGTCGSDRLVEVELARTLMNCVIEAMVLRSRLKTGMLIMSAVEESSRRRGDIDRRTRSRHYYFSTRLIFHIIHIMI
jgi:hypothetical protein